MTPAEATAAVAAKRGLPQQSYEASPVPQGSIHEGLWYVSERDGREMPIDDCVWIVFPDGFVARGIPVGNPIHPPTPPDELRPRPTDLDDPEAPWNWNTLSRAEAESQVATFPLTLYRDRDGWMTYEELFDSVSSEAATIPAEEAGWRDGEFDARDYIIEACQVGLYEALDVHPIIVTEYTDGTQRWTKNQLREHVFPAAAVADVVFEERLSRSLNAGELKTVAFLRYIAEGYGDEDEDGEPSGVVMERRINEPESACENRPDKTSSTEICVMDNAKVIGPISIGASGETKVLKLVQGDQVVGRLMYYNSTGTVVSVMPHEGPIHDRLVQEAKGRGLLHGKDIPDHLQHDQEHR